MEIDKLSTEELQKIVDDGYKEWDKSNTVFSLSDFDEATKELALREHKGETPNSYYTVQSLNIYDVQQAVGDDTIEYTVKEMKELAEYMEEETYNGDEWGTLLRNYHENKHGKN